MESLGFGVSGNKMKVMTKVAGCGGGTSSIAAKKEKQHPKKPKAGIFAAKT